MDAPSAKSENIALALGANIGDRLQALRGAIKGLASYLKIVKISPVYETPAAYITHQPAFLNAALIGETRFSPIAFLWSIKELEAELGRQPTFHYGPRAIDIDIIFYGAQILKTPELMLPHPRLAEREFVLRPLADIAPDWEHPETGLTVAEMQKHLPKSTAVRTADTL